MSWAVGYDERWQRDIGYGVPSMCDHPGCREKIDRGLAYVCGGEPYGGEDGCGLYFCSKHRRITERVQQCERCAAGWDAPGGPFEPTPDLPEWIEHKRTHPSWAKWREAQS